VTVAAGTPGTQAGDWIVACLCAQWCGICRGWREAFRDLALQSTSLLPASRWLWVDVESQADALGEFEPENFPVLAVQRGSRLLYCAALPQQAGNWRRMVQSLGALDEEQAQRWAAQLQDLGLDLRRLHDEAD
jgi:hypothetical protein